GADGHDIKLWLTGSRSEHRGIDAERDEDNVGAGAEPGAQPLRLTLRIRNNRERVAQRATVEAAEPAQLYKALWKPHRDVHDRRPHEAKTPEKDEWEADSIDRREHNVRCIPPAQ